MKQKCKAVVLGDGSLHVETDSLAQYAGKVLDIELQLPEHSEEPLQKELSPEAKAFLNWAEKGLPLGVSDNPEDLSHSRLAEERTEGRLS